MTGTLDFYFDIVSPFSYLAHVKLPALAARYGYRIAYHPMDIPMAKIAAGNYGPSNREIPAKIKVLMQDLNRWAQHYQVPLRFPKSFDCGRWNVAVLFANAEGKAEAFVREAWDRLYAKGGDPADDAELRGAATAAGLDADALMDYVASPRGRTEFNKACVEAHGKGVFGAPIMMIGDETWWGNDRLHFIEEYMAAHRQ